jgi:hypothetical protein
MDEVGTDRVCQDCGLYLRIPKDIERWTEVRKTGEQHGQS